MLQTFKATVKNLPDGLQVEGESRGFKIHIDEPKNLGGTDKHMTPVEALLCSLGACQAIVAKSFASLKRFSFEEMYIELEGDLDPDGFMGKNPNVRKGYQEIRYTMNFKTDESQEKAEKFAKFIESRCPVGDTLENGVKMVLSGVKVE